MWSWRKVFLFDDKREATLAHFSHMGGQLIGYGMSSEPEALEYYGVTWAHGVEPYE